MELNIRRLFLSGIVCGLLILIIGGCLVPLIGNRMDLVLKARQLPPLSTAAMVYFALVSIINGIGAMFLYVIICNQIKSKQKSVLLSSILFWFFTYVIANFALVAYGFMPLGLTLIGTLWGLLEILIGVKLGSMFYHKKINV